MKFLVPFSLFISLCSPLAQASLITIDYVAKVTQRSGDFYPDMDHQVGDLVSGQFIIDLTKAERVSIDHDGKRSVFTSHKNFDLVSGYFDVSSGNSSDSVALHDGIYPDLVPGGADRLSISDGFVNSSKGLTLFTSFNLSINLGELDWITTNGINVHITDAGSLANSFVNIGQRGLAYNPFDEECPCEFSNVSERLKLESLRISSVEVPEPSSLWLLAFGFFALVSKRFIGHKKLK